ncbi:MAG TPA: response regulator [Hyphomicrobiaceae bacterium]|nr:response regulator [Hyphomicrobiaceae bacterium]
MQKKTEQRRITRKRVLKGGVIAFSARHATIPCVVRDISEKGARLQVQNGAGVPDTFELIVELDGIEAHCAIVWRKPSEVGVEFLNGMTVHAPRRAQVIESSTSSLAKPSLRRNLQQRAPSVTPQPAPAPQSSVPPAQVAIPLAVTGEPALPKHVGDALAVATAARLESGPPAAGRASSAVTSSKRTSPRDAIPILIADDDPDDRLLIEDAFRESNFQHPIAFVDNGEDLLSYLRAEGRHASRTLPGLILLDLNMPRMDGRTALMHMKADRAFRRIPVIILTTSTAEEDIQRTYDLGVSAYMPKPGSYSELLELVESLNAYWMRYVALPSA